MDGTRLVAGASVSATGAIVFTIAMADVAGGFSSVYDVGLAGIGLLVGLVLVAAGAALFAISDLETGHVRRVAGWNALGVIVLGVVLALVLASPAVSLPPRVVADVLGVSAIAHVLIGVNDVRRIRVGELARERQKLAVLNRIVRHNLRNDAQVLLGNAESLATEIDNERLENMVDTIAGKATGLATMNRKLGRFQAAIEHDGRDERPVDVRKTVETVREDVLADHPEGTVDVDLPEGIAVRADDKLADALTELIENAIVHGGGSVSVSATRTDGHVELTVADDGSGIPEHEQGPLEEGVEITQLEHGTGVGLWVVRSVVDAYGGSLRYDTTDGTRVTLEITAA